MYGCDEKKKLSSRVRGFPKLFSSHNIGSKYVSFDDCSFNVRKGRDTTARVVVARELNIPLSYTLEATFAGSDYGPLKYCHMNTTHFQEVGAAMVDTILHFAIAEGDIVTDLAHLFVNAPPVDSLGEFDQLLALDEHAVADAAKKAETCACSSDQESGDDDSDLAEDIATRAEASASATSSSSSSAALLSTYENEKTLEEMLDEENRTRKIPQQGQGLTQAAQTADLKEIDVTTEKPSSAAVAMPVTVTGIVLDRDSAADFASKPGTVANTSRHLSAQGRLSFTDSVTGSSLKTNDVNSRAATNPYFHSKKSTTDIKKQL